LELKEYVKAITDQFSEKNWTDKIKRRKADKLISVGENLSDTGRSMIVDLMQKYLIIESPQYRENILETLSIIPNGEWKDTKVVYILPLLDPKDKNKTKSGKAVFYMFKEEIIKEYFNELNIKTVFCDEGDEDLPLNINQSPTKRIILVDDFIGTGDTAISYISELNNKGIENSKITIISIAAMREGHKKLILSGIGVFAGIVLEKGISSLEDQNLKNSYVIEMNKLEAESFVEEDRHFGYGQSEALITLIRTPNNVFPIFWYKKSPYAIFQR